MVCPAETPEGHAIGLVKNLALMAYIAVGMSPGLNYTFFFFWGVGSFSLVIATICEMLEEYGIEALDEISSARTVKTFVPHI